MIIDLYLIGRKGREVLKSIYENGYGNFIGKVTASRDPGTLEDCYDEIKAYCDKYNIPFFDRSSLKDSDGQNYRFMIGWKWLVTGTSNTFVFHDSLLPAYRGFSPLVNALIHGEKEIGATVFMASGEYDTGPIVYQVKFSVHHPARINEVLDKMCEVYGELALSLINNLTKEVALPLEIQEEAHASYSLWRDEEDYEIDWNRDSEYILRMIYALSFPFKGAFTLLNKDRIIIKDAELVKDIQLVMRDVGKLVFMHDDKCPVVVCGTGLLKIKEAYYSADYTSILPLKKFRSRFG